ncbi:hypothetical protein [Aestuariibacter sp. A3R04]|uniref:hypothetical protein n=1 Tax=Aestuariibacter sp. A3R04 TaxID=2841571 RepID=UPI001C09081E|nr:hypothetical protein [Aestuariibacter sp. A3R04]MBU3022987.1 hypothetical protein [Aestuariibacter sp. A3R04]
MQQSELATLMTECAADAIKTAQEEFNIELNGEANSVPLIDDILLSFLDKYHDSALEDSAVFTICNVYGAYIGECYRNIAGGQWRYDESNPDAPFVVLDVGERSYAFAGICYERLVNDSNISVAEYFNQALKQRQQ